MQTATTLSILSCLALFGCGERDTKSSETPTGDGVTVKHSSYVILDPAVGTEVQFGGEGYSIEVHVESPVRFASATSIDEDVGTKTVSTINGHELTCEHGEIRIGDRSYGQFEGDVVLRITAEGVFEGGVFEKGAIEGGRRIGPLP